MGERTCSVDGCENPLVSRGFCRKHYQRWLKYGGPAAKARWEKTPAERFWPKVDADGDCWVWMAGRTADGYGRFRADQETRVLAHRWSYEILVGEIQLGFQLDHLCKNPPCVNPDHLQPVPPRENVRRSSVRSRNVSKTHCPQGHPYSGENLIKSGSRRSCRVCKIASGRRSYWRRRARLSAAPTN